MAEPTPATSADAAPAVGAAAGTAVPEQPSCPARTAVPEQPFDPVGAVPAQPFDPAAFRDRVRELAGPLWRDLPWRRTRDPYLVWLSEVMLQQTQVPRVEGRWDEWLGRFPAVEALAAADDAEVLAAWQGMGYNRRALSLRRAAVEVVEVYGGEFPRERDALLGLPGVGPSTAAGIRAFAFDEADVYLETNVRSVFIHEFFPASESVPDRDLVPLVRAACPESGSDVRGWYYALLDYGAWLKKSVPTPSRRSSSYARQSRFEGSFRQKRAEVVRILLSAREMGLAPTSEQVAALLAEEEAACGRAVPGPGVACDVLASLEREGFCRLEGGAWTIGSPA